MPECQKGTSQLRSVVESATPPKRPSPSSSRARNKSYLQKLLPAETGAYATLTFGQWIPYIETYTYFTQYITILTIYMNKTCIHYIYVYIYTHTHIYTYYNDIPSYFLVRKPLHIKHCQSSRHCCVGTKAIGGRRRAGQRPESPSTQWFG